MQRLRGKRKRVYVLVALGTAAVLLAVSGGAAVVLHSARVAESAAPAVPLAAEDTSQTILAKESTSTVPIEVPVLVGMQLAEATHLLTVAGFVVVPVGTPPGEAAPGVVLSQTPSAGERAKAGSTVELVYADPAAVAAAAAGALLPTTAPANGLVVCIDPGHQASANNGQEPVGPGSAQTKAKVTAGATGVVTRQTEHALNLALALKIKERLERYGVTVVMTRSTEAVDISNAQRAQVANEAGADLFLRVHADSNTNADISGISTLYPAGNDWVAPIRAESLKAASVVHAEMIASAGAADRGVKARSDLSGFNWSTVPSVLVEVGFLSNPNDDKQLATAEYQDRLADGIARGVLKYLEVTP